MKLVLDANILFAALIRQGYAYQIVLSKKYTFYVPDFLINEIKKHTYAILRKGNFSQEQYNAILIFCLEQLKFIHITDNHITKARVISPDIGDIPYFATALQLNIPILSNDKRLKEQNVVKVIALHELE